MKKFSKIYRVKTKFPRKEIEKKQMKMAMNQDHEVAIIFPGLKSHHKLSRPYIFEELAAKICSLFNSSPWQVLKRYRAYYVDYSEREFDIDNNTEFY